jgi:hypothetical protein
MWGGVRWFPAIVFAVVSFSVCCSGRVEVEAEVRSSLPLSSRLFAGAVDEHFECGARGDQLSRFGHSHFRTWLFRRRRDNALQPA